MQIRPFFLQLFPNISLAVLSEFNGLQVLQGRNAFLQISEPVGEATPAFPISEYHDFRLS